MKASFGKYLGAALLFLCVSLPAREGRWAVVQTSGIFLRESADYTSENVSQSRMGTLVEILDSDRYWVKVRTPEPYEGWTNELCIAPVADPDAYLQAPKYICTAEYSHIFTTPSEEGDRLSDFLMGDMILKGTASRRGWSEVRFPDGRKGWVKSSDVRDFREWALDVCSKVSAERVCNLARRFVGVPYMWGGMGVKHFDCSGLVGFCYFMNGILLPRDASEQVKCGVEVPKEEMKAGDLVFFGETRVSHVALCIAPGRIIHSSQLVRINSLDPSDRDYYSRRILHVRRVLPGTAPASGTQYIFRSASYFKQ